MRAVPEKHIIYFFLAQVCKFGNEYIYTFVLSSLKKEVLNKSNFNNFQTDHTFSTYILIPYHCVHIKISASVPSYA